MRERERKNGLSNSYLSREENLSSLFLSNLGSRRPMQVASDAEAIGVSISKLYQKYHSRYIAKSLKIGFCYVEMEKERGSYFQLRDLFYFSIPLF